MATSSLAQTEPTHTRVPCDIVTKECVSECKAHRAAQLEWEESQRVVYAHPKLICTASESDPCPQAKEWGVKMQEKAGKWRDAGKKERAAYIPYSNCMVCQDCRQQNVSAFKNCFTDFASCAAGEEPFRESPFANPEALVEKCATEVLGEDFDDPDFELDLTDILKKCLGDDVLEYRMAVQGCYAGLWACTVVSQTPCGACDID